MPLDSYKRSQLLDLAEARKILCLGEIRDGSAYGLDFLLLVKAERIRTSSGGGWTSRRQLTQFVNSARKRIGITGKWIEVPNEAAEELSLRLQLELGTKFPGQIELVSIGALLEDPIPVWVHLEAGTLVPPDSKLMEEVVRDFFLLGGYRTPHVTIANAPSFPTEQSILRLVKVNQPTTSGEVLERLKILEPGAMDQRSLDHCLDRLRKNGLLIRGADGRYALTLVALRKLPPGKRRASSDVERILTFARRKW